ncbi:4Fe-4S binding protein [Desulfosporosinus hippei]|uniref:Epoxyqueuosine reductase QueG (Queuosine biosynthesis) n=1 Tax=Desulfosporosinus hippei DSM 8344 TaxID=1121419 RepID=A0A1G8GVL5_9FIRM|nr:4Fe-4S binding protein [Desulfosporosinus hippei]SDH98423.1 Epoxyqueuosine reductase QueG (queuosine biosynthesis) [Desulfosporosinus hippei DSM 8344]
MEKEIREFTLSIGVDDVGFANAFDYNSPKSYEITKFLPDAKSIIVLAFKVLSSCESPSLSIALNGYLDLEQFARNASYRVARFLENKFRAKVANIPWTAPFEIHNDRRAIADFSHRHAAVAAGLGSFGRHNLVIHPQFGTRVNFVSIITNLDLHPSPRSNEDFCIHCNLCVENCPGKALDIEGKTDLMKCMPHSLPYGVRTEIMFWNQLFGASTEEKKKMLMSEEYQRIRESHHLGNQYQCFNCMKSCPVGQ